MSETAELYNLTDLGDGRYSVEIDLCYDLDSETAEQASAEYGARFGCTPERQDRPSGNGWPVYRYTGTRAQVLALTADYSEGGVQ